MKERPIPVSGPEVRAILDGRQTQMRRIIKPQPQFGIGRYAEDGTPGEVDWVLLDYDGDPIDSALRCPYGAPGERLWVRETHALAAPSLSGRLEYDGARLVDSPFGPVEVWYRADGALGIMSMLFADGPRWRPSIHMPRWASRLTLEVTQVRVERLQDISEADAIEEGLLPVGGLNSQQMWAYSETTGGHFVDPRVAFHMLWNSIHGADSLAANPWVWVVEFQKVGET